MDGWMDRVDGRRAWGGVGWKRECSSFVETLYREESRNRTRPAARDDTVRVDELDYVVVFVMDGGYGLSVLGYLSLGIGKGLGDGDGCGGVWALCRRRSRCARRP